MIINEQSLDLVFRGFKSKYTDAYMAAPSQIDKVAMRVPSESREETYGWLGAFPGMREWIGERVVVGLEAYDFTIKNVDFESTIEVNRNDIADDRVGIFGPALSEMGHLSRQHPDEMVFGLLSQGFDTPCYDGQNFFDTDHPVKDAGGAVSSVSNLQAGAGPGWYLLDTSRAVRPLIWQERQGYQFVAMNSPTDANVFLNKKHLYGVDARVNAGFGLWQLAFGSRADLTPANYAAARAAMMDYRADGGRVLGINPVTLVVPPALESDALHVVNTELTTTGGSNPWKGTAELIVTPFATV